MTKKPELEEILEAISRCDSADENILANDTTTDNSLSKQQKDQINALIKRCDELYKFYEDFEAEIQEEQKKGYRECCDWTMSIYSGHIELTILPEIKQVLKQAKALRRTQSGDFDEKIKYTEEEAKKCEEKKSKILSNYYQNKFSLQSESPVSGAGHFLWKYCFNTKGHIGPSGNGV